MQPATVSPVEPVVSVIVPCYNSARTIRACLRALLNQQTTIPYEVIVVDSSTDETPRIVEREFPTVRLLHRHQRAFAGAARNLGIRATQAPFCLLIDSDCLAKSDLIEQVMARHQEGDYAAVGGCLRNGTPGSLSGLIGYWIEFKEFMPSAPRRLEKSIPTANLAYRRETFEKYGGFDDDMYMAEDILLNWKLYSQGERLLFDPALEVTHLNRTGWHKVLTIQIDFGRTSAIARRRGGLPGKILLDYPLLITLMPLVRTFRALQWFARYDRKTLLAFVMLWPLYLLAAGFWSYGFLEEALRR
ncbi:MAG: glycosyltransferase [Acidobacteria bacterium]|nr:glycosyltransferase [Acidobacteriota bacterium]